MLNFIELNYFNKYKSKFISVNRLIFNHGGGHGAGHGGGGGHSEGLITRTGKGIQKLVSWGTDKIAASPEKFGKSVLGGVEKITTLPSKIIKETRAAIAKVLHGGVGETINAPLEMSENFTKGTGELIINPLKVIGKAMYIPLSFIGNATAFFANAAVLNFSKAKEHLWGTFKTPITVGKNILGTTFIETPKKIGKTVVETVKPVVKIAKGIRKLIMEDILGLAKSGKEVIKQAGSGLGGIAAAPFRAFKNGEKTHGDSHKGEHVDAHGGEHTKVNKAEHGDAHQPSVEGEHHADAEAHGAPDAVHKPDSSHEDSHGGDHGHADAHANAGHGGH
jgi:hypothetical protein